MNGIAAAAPNVYSIALIFPHVWHYSAILTITSSYRLEQANKIVQSALSEDANAFAYDEVYTDLQANRQKAAAESDSDRQQRQSKYISGLLKTAEVRKRENEILFERKLLKDRAAEDDEFGDKPKYVTGAYKEKLKEQQRWLEEQKVIEAREAAEAVGAKGDRAFSSFYSNLLERKAGGGAVVSAPASSSAASAASLHPTAVSAPPRAPLSQLSEQSALSTGASLASSSSSSVLQSSHQSASAAAAENKKRSRWGDDAAAGSSFVTSGGAALLHTRALASESALMDPRHDSEPSLTADKRPRISSQSAAAGISEPAGVALLHAADGSAPGSVDSDGKATKVLSARERYLQRKQQVQDAAPLAGV